MIFLYNTVTYKESNDILQLRVRLGLKNLGKLFFNNSHFNRIWHLDTPLQVFPLRNWFL